MFDGSPGRVGRPGFLVTSTVEVTGERISPFPESVLVSGPEPCADWPPAEPPGDTERSVAVRS